MADVRSEHVVALNNATKTSASYYLLLELCNGGDLSNFVKQRNGYLKEEEARIILRQIVKGIAAIKTKDVMHRDLKLPNIMLHFKGQPKDICTDNSFNLNQYIKDFDFAHNYDQI